MPACRLSIRVIPGARHDSIDGLHDGSIKVRLKAPAVDGKANRALLAFLAKRLGRRPRDLLLIIGQTSRQKVIEIRDMDEKMAHDILLSSQEGESGRAGHPRPAASKHPEECARELNRRASGAGIGREKS